MRIEFDADKDAANVAKHGVSLVFGAAVWSDTNVLVISSFREIDGEERFKAIGMVASRIWTAVHVRRNDAIRLISVRKGNEGERRLYDRAQGRSQRP